MAKKQRERKGGLKRDPEVAAFQEGAAENVAALTKKQRADRARVRVRLDVPPELKERLEKAASQEGTSLSQLGAFLLHHAMDLYESDEALRQAVEGAKQPSRSMRVEFNLDF